MIQINNKFVLSIFAASIVALTACVSNKQRNPSGAKSATEISFSLFTANAPAGTHFRYELINLFDLQNSKVNFARQDISLSDSQKNFNDWLQQLKSYNANSPTDLNFTFNKLPISVKNSDFKRLERALDLLSKSNETPDLIYRKQVELVSAFNQNFKEPLELDLEITTIPFQFLKRISGFYIKNKKADPSFNVENSSFWTDRSKSSVDMSRGPSELNLAPFAEAVCEYSGPKKGFGIHQGLKAKCLNRKFKVKLGEEKSAPLNSRIYHRLGYNVPAIHNVKSLKMAYNRKIFTEISSSKQQHLHFKLLGKEVKNIPVRKQNHFKEYVSHAVLKNGESLKAADFFGRLLPHCPTAESCHLSDANYDQNFENEINYIVFQHIAIVEETNDHDFGKWAFDELDHSSRPEVKALVLVGAITGNHDLRKDNNELIWSAKNFEIKHIISDPGSGYGSGMPFAGFNINEMRWHIMKENQPSAGDAQQNAQTQVLIDGYKPNASHKAFSKLNYNEAVWIGRQIAGISEDELTEAMAASGLSMAELLLAREKFISMQQNIVDVLDLEDEFVELMKRPINKKISHQPTGKPQVIKLKNGKEVAVEDDNEKLESGKLK